MAGLVPAIHVFGCTVKKDVDARVKPGHDGEYRNSAQELLVLHLLHPPRIEPPQRLQLRRGRCRLIFRARGIVTPEPAQQVGAHGRQQLIAFQSAARRDCVDQVERPRRPVDH